MFPDYVSCIFWRVCLSADLCNAQMSNADANRKASAAASLALNSLLMPRSAASEANGGGEFLSRQFTSETLYLLRYSNGG